MIKKFLAIIMVLSIAACASNQGQDKTPRTEIGKLNGCMLDMAYDYKAQGRIKPDKKWEQAREILNTCERKLHISSREINETQSINIIASVLATLN